MLAETEAGLAQFAAAALIAAVIVGLLIPRASKIGAMSQVRSDRWHRGGAVPSLAGPAILAGLLPWTQIEFVALLAGFCLIGVIDDVRELQPATKGILLLVPSALAGYVTGEPWVAMGCWIAVNAVNLLDHADGLVGSTSCASLLVAGGPLGIAGAGVCAGFLLYNMPPARAFLGDGGSYTLGAAMVLAWHDYGPVLVLLGLAIPLIDTSFVVLRRLLAHRPFWQGGTDHTGHLLLRRGMPSMALLLLYGGLAAAIALAARGIAA